MLEHARVGRTIPTFTMGDRLRKAREGTGLTTRAFAEQLGVSQSTVTNAENDRSRTRRITLLMWSQVTGVPVAWLQTGEAPAPPAPGSATDQA